MREWFENLGEFFLVMLIPCLIVGIIVGSLVFVGQLIG